MAVPPAALNSVLSPMFFNIRHRFSDRFGAPGDDMSGDRAVADGEKLRVLCVTPVGPDGMGGIDRLYFYMRQYSQARGTGSGLDIRYFASRGPSSGLRSMLAFPARLLAFVWLMMTQRFDVVHVNVSTHGSALRKWALASLAKLFGRRVSIHFHAMVEDRIYDERPICFPAYRALCRKADRIVILGDFFVHEFRNRLGIAPDKLVVIHNGIPDFVGESSPAKPVDGPRLILFAGEVGPRKGAGLLLEALAILRQSPQEWRCIIAGNGDIPEYRSMAGMLGLKDRVSFTGWVGSDQMHDLMRKADIVVLPSRIEALPLSLIEGACAGAALVSSNAGASAEVTCDGRNGLIVPLGSEAIAEALTHLLADPALLATMQGESRKVFLERFRIDQFEQALRAMLIEVAARPLPQSRAVPAA